MKVNDFIKDIAVNLTQNNVREFKNKATHMVLSAKGKLTGEEIANIINTYSYYDDIINIFGTKKAIFANIKIMMDETDYSLNSASEMYNKYPEIYKLFNEPTKKSLFKNVINNFAKMDPQTYKEYLDYNDNLWTENNMTNPLKDIYNGDAKPTHITQLVNHKNFKKFPSHYPLERLLVAHKELIATEAVFTKIVTRLLGIISESKGWNTDFTKEFAPIVNNKFFKMEHFDLFSDKHIEQMREFALRNYEALDPKAMETLYKKFGDHEFISDELKDVFVF